jgi:polyhydroxyalkanoate synthase
MSSATTPSLMDWWQQAAGANPWAEFYQRMAAVPRFAEAIKNVRVGITPSDVVYTEDKLSLLRYQHEGDVKFKTPLIVVFALVNRPYILDLKPGKSVVSHFVTRGFDTFKVDWGVPTSSDRSLTIEDYVLRYLDHVVDRARKLTGSEQVNILGYCMGGTLSAMYAAMRPAKVRNLMMLAAPVDWSTQDSLLQLWTDPKVFDVDKFIDTFGNAPPWWLQGSFQLLKPVQNIFEKPLNLFDNLDDDKYVEDFLAMETWLNDNIPVAGETFRRFVKDLFQRNLLTQGRFTLAGEKVDLRNIACPVLNLIAQHDHLVPPSQSLPLIGAVGSADKKTITFPAGHIGLAVSSKAHRDLWPQVCDWLAERSERVD